MFVRDKLFGTLCTYVRYDVQKQNNSYNKIIMTYICPYIINPNRARNKYNTYKKTAHNKIFFKCAQIFFNVIVMNINNIRGKKYI